MIEQLHQEIKAWIKQAGEMAKKGLEDGLTVDTKTSASDLVTNIDKAIQESFIAYIYKHYPTHHILGEEDDTHITSMNGYVWIIDPIDGTLNYVKEKENYGITVSLYINGQGTLAYIYDVAKSHLYHMIAGQGVYCNEEKLQPLDCGLLKDAVISISSSALDIPVYQEIMKKALSVRVIGCSSQSFIRVITGKYGAYISCALPSWDFAAGAMMIKELGGKCTQPAGTDLNILQKTPIIASSGTIHQELINMVKGC
ncbi:inositol monophosphatase family protein [Carnobacteriaceae bacterium zg-ZUI78]|nr:inositol monophosphatase family protein [Carnobacteriaceae bacterium zg-ZUI78]